MSLELYMSVAGGRKAIPRAWVLVVLTLAAWGAVSVAFAIGWLVWLLFGA